MYMAHVCFYVRCSDCVGVCVNVVVIDCVGVCGNVFCVAAVVKDSVFLPWSVEICCMFV